MNFTGKPEGVAYITTDFGELLLSDHEASVIRLLLDGPNTDSVRLQLLLLLDFYTLLARDEAAE